MKQYQWVNTKQNKTKNIVNIASISFTNADLQQTMTINNLTKGLQIGLSLSKFSNKMEKNASLDFILLYTFDRLQKGEKRPTKKLYSEHTYASSHALTHRHTQTHRHTDTHTHTYTYTYIYIYALTSNGRDIHTACRYKDYETKQNKKPNKQTKKKKTPNKQTNPKTSTQQVQITQCGHCGLLCISVAKFPKHERNQQKITLQHDRGETYQSKLCKLYPHFRLTEVMLQRTIMQAIILKCWSLKMMWSNQICDFHAEVRGRDKQQT